jgi:DNA-directed RNA polymerase specialized sigma24 family protein
VDSNGNGDDRDRPGQLAITTDLDAARPGEPETIQIRGDELDLYAEFHEELYRTIRALVFSSPETAADACSFAWLQFLRYQPDRESPWKGWMVTTAQHEAWRLNAIERRNRDFTEAEVKGILPVDPNDRFAERVAFDAALQQLKRLPLELQRVVLIRSQVWKKEEVAEVMGIRPDQVEPLLRAAAIRLAEVNENRHDRERPVASPRAARLRELEDDPPDWLHNVIGRCPQRSKSSAGVILAWRRAALAIEDYRRVSGYENPHDALGFIPRNHDLKRAYVLAERAIVRVTAERERRHGIDR